jgi:hypothetical protein
MELTWSTECGLHLMADELAAAVRRPRVIATVLVERRCPGRPDTRADGSDMDEVTWEDAAWQ